MQVAGVSWSVSYFTFLKMVGDFEKSARESDEKAHEIAKNFFELRKGVSEKQLSLLERAVSILPSKYTPLFEVLLPDRTSEEAASDTGSSTVSVEESGEAASAEPIEEPDVTWEGISFLEEAEGPQLAKPMLSLKGLSSGSSEMAGVYGSLSAKFDGKIPVRGDGDCLLRCIYMHLIFDQKFEAIEALFSKASANLTIFAILLKVTHTEFHDAKQFYTDLRKGRVHFNDVLRAADHPFDKVICALFRYFCYQEFSTKAKDFPKEIFDEVSGAIRTPKKHLQAECMAYLVKALKVDAVIYSGSEEEVTKIFYSSDERPSFGTVHVVCSSDHYDLLCRNKERSIAATSSEGAEEIPVWPWISE